jgi:sugar phosphate isomerase/epimerase
VIPHSPDAEVALVAESRIRKALETADHLNCSNIIFHTGINTLIRHPVYLERVTETQAAFWKKMAEDFPNLIICLENMWERSADVFKAIMVQADHPRLKVCFDCGHANVFSDQPLNAWIDELSDYIEYMHWNDNLGDRDSELSVGKGNIDWSSFVQRVLDMACHPRIVLEVGTVKKIKESLAFLAQLQVLNFSVR